MIKNAVQNGAAIEVNCHGLSFNLLFVTLPDGARANFWLVDNADVVALRDAQYKKRTNAEAQADLAANKKVIAIWGNLAGTPVHSAIATKIVLKADGSLDPDKSLFDTKNGITALKNGESVNKINDVYANPNVPLAFRAVGWDYYTLK